MLSFILGHPYTFGGLLPVRFGHNTKLSPEEVI